MYIPNIPGVTTSVVDRTEIEVVINNDRSILLPIFSKYGKEGFMTSIGKSKFAYNHGRMDLKKYGIAYLFGEKASQKNRVLSYRLLPDDATYANNVLSVGGTYSVKQGVTTKELIFKKKSAIDGTLTDDTDVLMAFLAKERGEGYNSVFVTFSPAKDFEKADANKDGETNYKFNFVKAEIYEETPSGVKALGSPIVFSLMEVDPFTNEPISDKVTGEQLFINKIFKEKNDFATLMINDGPTSTAMNELLDYANIDIVMENRRLIIKDATAEVYYEIKVENYTALEPDINGVNRAVIKQRISKVITNTLPYDDNIKYIRLSGSTGVNTVENTFELTLDENKELKVETISNSALLSIGTASIPEAIIIDGEDAFYNIKVVKDGAIYKIQSLTEFEGSADKPFLRHRLYNKLMTYSMKLYEGFDGKYLTVNGSLNFGSGAPGQQSAKELLLDFYNNNQDIREVLYPKYDFDYIPDWTEDVGVMQSIVGLADDIGLSMPLISCPHDKYNPKIVSKDIEVFDIEARKDRLHMSSYNSMLYSSQMNKTHKLANGGTIYMPFSYYAMCAHLRIDELSITEPVANIEKGTFDTELLNLTYAPTSLAIEQMRNVQINTAIVEPDGTYIIDQLTMYKKASKLSRANVVKTLHRIRKDLPKVLKPLLQLKETTNIKDTAVRKANQVLNKWKVTDGDNPDGIFSMIEVKGSFDEAIYKLRLTVTVKPIGTIESIDVPIIVV